MMASVSPVLDHRHHDHRSCADDALRHAEATARREGLRLTEQRRRVLAALLESHVPASAYDVIDRLAGDGRRPAPVSIYRALDFLVEQGFVHRLSSRNAFIACPHGHGADEAVAFLICEVCGGVDEDASPAMRSAIRGMAQARQFKTSYQVVEIVGRCEHCRNAEAA
jgi:Fur family zinc uptake transcriptional regulator